MRVFLVALFLVISGWILPAGADVEVDVGFFYDRLSPYGSWYDHHQYGWVWCPDGTPVGWRPYTRGHWIDTDDYGWMWVSDWDWGWAPFHYGRWVYDDYYGWIWVPGYVWGPAWVAWRTGGGFIGWAPLPPEVGWDEDEGLVYDGFNLEVGIGWSSWVFVDQDRFLEPRLHEHIVLAPRNVTIIRNTRNVTRISIVNRRVVNESLSLEHVEKMTGRTVHPMRVREVDRISEMRRSRDHGGEIAVFRPRVRASGHPVTPPSPGDLSRKHAAEHAALGEQQQTERSRLEQRQEAERKNPQVDQKELPKRQEEERKALAAEHEKQKRLLDHRQERERQQREKR